MFPELTKQALRCLLADRFIWQKTSNLADIADGITDVNHRVISEEEIIDGETRTVYYQMEEVENPNAQVFRLGFTVSEIERIIQ